MDYPAQCFSAPPQWAVDSIKGYEGHTWAPDIIYYKGNYHLFYSCSAFGKIPQPLAMPIAGL